MRRLFALVLALVMLLTLAACGENEEVTPESTETTTDTAATTNTTQEETQASTQSPTDGTIGDEAPTEINPPATTEPSAVTEPSETEPQLTTPPSTEAVHTHNYTSKIVTAPTCTEKGYTTYTCSCGDSYTADEVDAAGHSYANATCTTAQTCSCGATSGSALGHYFNQGICTRCSATDPDYTEQDTSSKTVYITATGKKYHSTRDCSGLNNAKAIYESTLTEATNKGLGPCSKCH